MIVRDGYMNRLGTRARTDVMGIGEEEQFRDRLDKTHQRVVDYVSSWSREV